MRGISKPWPPTDVYPDDHEPASIREAEQAFLVELPEARDQGTFARSNFNGLAKQKLRDVMYREQRSLCIYCERKITEDYPPPTIEHWRPLRIEPRFSLHWNNLYLSCTWSETCDRAKGDRPLRWDETDPHMPWPVDLPYEDFVGFTSRGEIYVRSDVALPDATRRALQLAIADRPDGARVRRGIVNLNHPALVAARAAAIDSERTRIARDFENRTATRDQRETRATHRLGQNPRPAFVSIRVAWLRKSLGRGR